MNVIELIEKSVRVSNSDNADRQFAVEANVTLRGSQITSVNDGYVRTVDGNMHLCNFNGIHNLNVNFDSMAEDRTAVLAAIEEFMAALNAEELV